MKPIRSVGTIVGFLVCVELASGVLQGYYTPIFTDIARHLTIHDADVNWFEAAQLIVSAVTVPLLARLGDAIGHRRVLLGATAVTAVAALSTAFAPNFATFLVAWAFIGFYVVWLPLEVAIIHRRTHGDARRTRAAAGLLVGALEIGVIIAALAAGQLAGTIPMTVLLLIPGIAVLGAFVAIYFGVSEPPVISTGRVDWSGFAMLTVLLAFLMAGLVVLRLTGPGAPWPWLLIVAALALGWPFAVVERRADNPLVDLPVLLARRQWPVQCAAALFGASVLGAQIPLSTFARTDPAQAGFGLGASAATLSLLVGAYVLALAAGALSYPILARRCQVGPTMAGAATLVAIGYLLFLVAHSSMGQLTVNMVIAGLGSGALVAALPAAAAAHAPDTHTGFVTGMTNAIKTVGGAVASAIYAIALSAVGSIDTAGSVHASLGGYLTVWAVCGGTAVIAAVVLAVDASGCPR